MSEHQYVLKESGCVPFRITKDKYEMFKQHIIKDRQEKAQQAIFDLIYTMGKPAAQTFIEKCLACKTKNKKEITITQSIQKNDTELDVPDEEKSFSTDTAFIIRRVDTLGRVMIPKEFREYFRLQDGDPLAFSVNRKNEILIKKCMEG